MARSCTHVLALLCLLGCLTTGFAKVKCYKTQGHDDHERRSLLAHEGGGTESKSLELEAEQDADHEYDACIIFKIEHVDPCDKFDENRCIDEDSHDGDDDGHEDHGHSEVTVSGHFYGGIDCSGCDFSALTADETKAFREDAEQEINEHMKVDLGVNDMTAHIEHDAIVTTADASACNNEDYCNNAETAEGLSLSVSSASSLMLSTALLALSAATVLFL